MVSSNPTTYLQVNRLSGIYLYIFIYVLSYWGIEPHTFRLQNGRYAWLAYTTNIIYIYALLPKAGIEPTLDAYEASVLTIELPKLKGG